MKKVFGSRKQWFFFLVLLLLIVSLTSCAKSPKVKKITPKTGGEFNYFLQEPFAIDPLNVQESEGFEVAKELFDGLVDYDPRTMAVIPAVARSWKSNPEATVFTFNLRQKTKFHNGREVVAKDFKYAWERVAKKGSGSDVAYHLAPIKGFDEMQAGKARRLSGVKVKDKYTLEVALNYPFADFPTILGHPVFSPVPREEVEKDPRAFTEMPVGNGPFMMASPWKRRQLIEVRRFERYYGSKAFLKKVNFRIFADVNTAFLEFKSGALDFTPIPLGQVRATKEEFKGNAIVGKPQLSLDFLGFNLNAKPFKNNPNLRLAIGYAIDRQGIAKTVFEDTRLPAASLSPPILRDSTLSKKPKRRLDKAKSLLKQAGYPRGKGLPPLKLTFIAGGGSDQLAQAIQANLTDIGVNVQPESMEAGAFFDALHENKVKLFLANWIADYPTLDSFTYPLFYSMSGDNPTGYRNASVDKLLLAARKSLDKNKRRQIYLRAETKILEDAPVVPLFFAGSSAVYDRDVRGFIRTAQDGTPLELIWIKKIR